MNERRPSDDEAFGTGAGSGDESPVAAPDPGGDATVTTELVVDDAMAAPERELIDAVADFMDDLVEVEQPTLEPDDDPGDVDGGDGPFE